MLPGMEMMGCTNLAVPAEVMHHVVKVESSRNPYAIGVVGGRLVRQPRNLPEALATVRALEARGFNFSLGLAQVNRYNLTKYGLASYEKAFEICPNLQAGSRILAECHDRAKGDWGKAFSCYYSGNFVTGYRHGYVQKVVASWRAEGGKQGASPIPVIDQRKETARFTASRPVSRVMQMADSLLQRRSRFVAQPSMQPAQQTGPAIEQQRQFPAQPSKLAVGDGTRVISQSVALAMPDRPVQVQAVGAPSTNNSRGTARPPQPVGARVDDAFVF